MQDASQESAVEEGRRRLELEERGVVCEDSRRGWACWVPNGNSEKVLFGL